VFLNVPAAQLEQEATPAAENLPAEHLVQVVPFEKVPAAHTLQLPALPAENFPAAHATHLLAPADEAVPAAQGTQLGEPKAAEYVPAMQRVHWEAPVVRA
jgi:hypothetical protein